MMKKIINESLKKQNIHFFVILACIAMQMFTIGEAYRFFAYLNVLIVAVGLYQCIKVDAISRRRLVPILLFPASFAVLHFIAQQDVMVLKEMRHLLIAICLAIGVLMLSYKNRAYLENNLYLITAVLILVYATVQVLTITFFDHMPYGTTKNPHYLAFYSVVGLVVSFYCFIRGTLFYRCFFSICMLLLGFLLLKTGSRPAWIGLFVSSFVIIAFLNKRQKLQAFMGLSAVVLMLSITNAGGFLDRSRNLIMNLGSEERVTIWSETWAMQKSSSPVEWLVGHGIDSFEEDFKPYSSYHLEQIDFNSPHNYFLEMLYISGLLGLVSFLFMFGLIYQKIIKKILDNDLHKAKYIMLFSILTTSFIFAGITLPFFNAKSMNLIAYLVGITFYLDYVQQTKLKHE